MTNFKPETFQEAMYRVKTRNGSKPFINIDFAKILFRLKPKNLNKRILSVISETYFLATLTIVAPFIITYVLKLFGYFER